MKIYLDSSDITEIEEAAKTGLLDGITTNPSLISKQASTFNKLILDIVKIMKKHTRTFTISVEVTKAKSKNEIIKQAREIAKINEHIIVKIPLTVEGLKAVSELAEEGIRSNVTLCFSANQALLAAKAGAYIISPFVGRLEDEGIEGMQIISDIKKIYSNYGFETMVLAASIRSPEHIHRAALIGSDICTMPYQVFKKLYYNPLTDIGIEQFEKDWESFTKKKNK